MKDILRVPLFTLMLFCLVAIAFVTIYILVARHHKFAVALEKICIGLLFLLSLAALESRPRSFRNSIPSFS